MAMAKQVKEVKDRLQGEEWMQQMVHQCTNRFCIAPCLSNCIQKLLHGPLDRTRPEKQLNGALQCA